MLYIQSIMLTFNVTNNTRAVMCRLCKKNGKSDEEAKGHTPGPLCPIVMSFKCGHCGEMGHTGKHCPKLQDLLRKQTIDHDREQATMITFDEYRNRNAKPKIQLLPAPKPEQTKPTDDGWQIQTRGARPKTAAAYNLTIPVHYSSRFNSEVADKQVEQKRSATEQAFPGLAATAAAPAPALKGAWAKKTPSVETKTPAPTEHLKVLVPPRGISSAAEDRWVHNPQPLSPPVKIRWGDDDF